MPRSIKFLRADASVLEASSVLGLTIGTIMLLMTASFLVFVSDWLLRLFVLKSHFYLIGCLATVELAFSSWIVSAAFGFCISLWTEPLELRHTDDARGGVGSFVGDFIRSISAIRVQRQF